MSWQTVEEDRATITLGVFNVLLDFDRGTVTVEDELDVEAAWTTSLEDFMARLGDA